MERRASRGVQISVSGGEGRYEEKRGEGKEDMLKVYYGKDVVTLFAVNDADDQRETTAMSRIS